MLEPLDPKKMESDLAEQISASMPQFQLRKPKKETVSTTGGG
jgi:hypothetical protein